MYIYIYIIYIWTSFFSCLFVLSKLKRKQEKTKMLIESIIILILKSVLKEFSNKKQSSPFKAKHICPD